LATSVTKNGITWSFDADESVGQYANGDYWVVGPVTITSITPNWTGTQNGWELNPLVQSDQGFEDNADYNATLRPSLPWTVTSGSVVKVIGGSDVDSSTVAAAAVLTVVSSTPTGNGSGLFRPPYVGTSKPEISVSDFDWTLMPVFTMTASAPSLATVESSWSDGFHMDHHSTKPRQYRPQDALSAYQPANTADISNAMLRLMGPESNAAKQDAMIHFTQYCIDQGYAVIEGYRRQDNGHNPHHRACAAWAAYFLDLSAVKTALLTATDFHEDYYLYENVNGVVVWGETSTESQYWNYIMGLGGSRSRKDPYSYIDGGDLDEATGGGAAYQYITSQSLKGQSLFYNLVPGVKEMFDSSVTGQVDNLEEYADRWVNHGVWATPDPYAPYDGNNSNYGVTYGPDGMGDGILGSGRFPSRHGDNADAGQYKSDFVAEMWDSYHTNNRGVIINSRNASTALLA
jgi:hypothetical protein